jgi:hypothetical protein
MSEQYLGSQPNGYSNGGAILIERRRAAPGGRRASDNTGDKNALQRFEQEQFERDIADIERAAAALRIAEPALESWSKPAIPVLPKVRPLWLLIGVLWLSTALFTAGAVVAIASLAG